MPEPKRFLKNLSTQEKCDLAEKELRRTKEIGLKNGMSNSSLAVKKIKK